MEVPHSCARCGEVILAQEPRVVVREYGTQAGSACALEPALAHKQRHRYHLDCYVEESCAPRAALLLTSRARLHQGTCS
jgi:hypothetical protein